MAERAASERSAFLAAHKEIGRFTADEAFASSLMEATRLCLDFAAHWAAKRMFARERLMLAANASGKRRLMPPSVLRGPLRIDARASGVHEADAAFWISMSAQLARAGEAGDDWPEDRRGYSHICRLTGLSWQDAQWLVADGNRFSAQECAAVWAPAMSPAHPKMIGFIYAAKSDALPGLTKIGFTTNIAKRERSLSRDVGASVRIIGFRPATMLHEWVLHQAIFKPSAHEWHASEHAPHWLIGCNVSKEAA